MATTGRIGTAQSRAGNLQPGVDFSTPPAGGGGGGGGSGGGGVSHGGTGLGGCGTGSSNSTYNGRTRRSYHRFYGRRY